MYIIYLFIMVHGAGPDGSFVSLVLVTWGYQVRIPGSPDICHRGCAYTVLQTVQRHSVYSAAYGTVHYKEPLKSFKRRVGHSPGFGLPSVAILPWLCRKRRKAIFIYIHGARDWNVAMVHVIECGHGALDLNVAWCTEFKYGHGALDLNVAMVHWI